jgi:hypothetical protein
MEPANNNDKKNESDHFTSVNVIIPKDKVFEIRSIAIQLLKEYVEDKKTSPKKSTSRSSPYLVWLKLFFKKRPNVVHKDCHEFQDGIL